MLVHDQFVFLQMRKTGSTYLTDALQRELPSEICKLQKHSNWARIPPQAVGRPVLSFIRNPWDWYVSWYHFNLMRGGTPNGFWKAVSAQGTLNFTDTVHRACHVAAAVMGGDLYSTLFRNLIGDGLNSELLTVGRFELLIDDLESFLSAAGVKLTNGGVARIRAGSPLNASDRGPYREYYNKELRDLVGEWCQPLIDRFGYTF
jgi:hypothetical protein